MDAVPGVQNLLIRVGNVEEKCDSLGERVQALESRDLVSSDKVKDIFHDDVSELKEIKSRRLNLICLNLPESKKTDTSERQQEDLDLLINVMENKMNLDPDIINVNKLVRLGRRDVANDRIIRCRPLRFTVHLTGPGSSVGRVSASGNGRSRVRSRATTYQRKSLKMVLAAPGLAPRLTG